MFYDNVKEACKLRDTNVTTVLKEIGRATGNTGSWKLGQSPKIDIVMEIAEYLNISVDDLVYGFGKAPYKFSETHVSELDNEWLEIISHIPEERQQMCKDFLRTHMSVPDKFVDGKMA